MPRGRVHARAVAGAVVIEVDPVTAVDLAEALAATHRGDQELQSARPWWSDDVADLVTAARMAAGEANRVDVAFLQTPASGRCGEARPGAGHTAGDCCG